MLPCFFGFWKPKSPEKSERFLALGGTYLSSMSKMMLKIQGILRKIYVFGIFGVYRSLCFWENKKTIFVVNIVLNWNIFYKCIFFWIWSEIYHTLHKIYCAKYISWLFESFSWFQLPDLYFLIYTLAQHLVVVHRYKISDRSFLWRILIYTRLLLDIQF